MTWVALGWAHPVSSCTAFAQPPIHPPKTHSDWGENISVPAKPPFGTGAEESWPREGGRPGQGHTASGSAGAAARPPPRRPRPFSALRWARLAPPGYPALTWCQSVPGPGPRTELGFNGTGMWRPNQPVGWRGGRGYQSSSAQGHFPEPIYCSKWGGASCQGGLKGPKAGRLHGKWGVRGADCGHGDPIWPPQTLGSDSPSFLLTPMFPELLSTAARMSVPWQEASKSGPRPKAQGPGQVWVVGVRSLPPCPKGGSHLQYPHTCTLRRPCHPTAPPALAGGELGLDKGALGAPRVLSPQIRGPSPPFPSSCCWGVGPGLVFQSNQKGMGGGGYGLGLAIPTGCCCWRGGGGDMGQSWATVWGRVGDREGSTGTPPQVAGGREVVQAHLGRRPASADLHPAAGALLPAWALSAHLPAAPYPGHQQGPNPLPRPKICPSSSRSECPRGQHRGSTYNLMTWPRWPWVEASAGLNPGTPPPSPSLWSPSGATTTGDRWGVCARSWDRLGRASVA